MNRVEQFVLGVIVVGVACFAVYTNHMDSKRDCMREGIKAGWATEAIKELCK